MKNLSIICVFFCILTISCEKNITEILENSVQESTLSSSEPLEYASVEELINAIYSQNIDVRSSDFVSYAETVMQEDGYDDLPWAINSVNFASILNSEGEVIFDDVFLKLCRYGKFFISSLCTSDIGTKYFSFLCLVMVGNKSSNFPVPPKKILRLRYCTYF